MPNIAAQVPATGVVSISSNGNGSNSFENEDARLPSAPIQIEQIQIEQIQEELSLAALRQANIQARIHSIREALSALLKVFGPGILNPQAENSAAVAHTCSGKIGEVCLELLKKSGSRGLTAHQMLKLIREKWPLTLAGSRNPETSLSNTLRGLRRRSLIEARRRRGGKLIWLATSAVAEDLPEKAPDHVSEGVRNYFV